MTRSKRLRSRLVLVYLAATLLPLVLTIRTSFDLLDRSLNLSPVRELDDASYALETLGREYYQQEKDSLSADAAAGRVSARVYVKGEKQPPAGVREFRDSGEERRFETTGEGGKELQLLVRKGSEVLVYSRELNVGMRQLAAQISGARDTVASSRGRDWRRGFFYTLLAVSSAAWFAGLAFLVYWANRLSRPVQRLARGLGAVADGDLSVRIPVDRDDEVGAATAAFNTMADQLQASREKLIRITRLESWQALARKTAHEVKNSLTPIRLTMEEIVARQHDGGDEFLKQAAQIVVDEVMSLERARSGVLGTGFRTARLARSVGRERSGGGEARISARRPSRRDLRRAARPGMPAGGGRSGPGEGRAHQPHRERSRRGTRGRGRDGEDRDSEGSGGD